MSLSQKSWKKGLKTFGSLQGDKAICSAFLVPNSRPLIFLQGSLHNENQANQSPAAYLEDFLMQEHSNAVSSCRDEERHLRKV